MLKVVKKIDAQLTDRLSCGPKPALLRALFVAITRLGEMAFLWLLLALGASIVSGNWRYVGCMTLGQAGLYLLVTRLIKARVKRPRPLPLRQSRDPYSFPSGHAASSVMGAMLLGHWFPAFATLLSSIAAAIIYSRLYLGKHYLSDVVAGMLIGMIGGILVLLL